MTLFTLFGIRVKAGLTAVFLLLMMSTSMMRLLAATPGISEALIIPLGILLGVGLIASVIAHEYGHSLVARHFNVHVREIIIHLFGGAALMENGFPSAKSEFWIALAGPLVSFACALLFLWFGIDPIFGFLPLEAIKCFQVLGFVNLILGVFNLVPAFPLDGGRILRAGIWQYTGDYSKATRIAGVTGYVFAGLMGLWGLWDLVHGDIGGLWNLVFAAFIAMLTHAEVKRIPKTIPVRDPDTRILNQEIE